MKRIFPIVTLILFCFSLASCAAKHLISRDIIDPVNGFSRSEEDILIYKDNKYILLQEINGDCEINISNEAVLLGQISNFPFFPNSYFYVNTDENPNFIMGRIGSVALGTFVYLREDIYNDNIIYALNDSSSEFEFASSFIKTDKVNYDVHIEGKKYTKVAILEFHMKEIPTITAVKRIYEINNTWYCIEADIAYQLSDELMLILTKEGIINEYS